MNIGVLYNIHLKIFVICNEGGPMDLYLDRIKPLFESSGETDKEIEESLGLPRGVIYKWGMGENKSYKKFIPQIAKKYRVSADYLMGLVDSAIPEQKENAPDPKIEGARGAKQALMDAIDDLTEEQCEKLLPIVLSAKTVL